MSTTATASSGLGDINHPARNNHNDESMPIRLLPIIVRQELCEHLDSLDVVFQLAKFVKLYPNDVEQIRKQQVRGRSAANEFFTIWGGQYNHTMKDLYALFYKMKLHNAMRLIKDYVDENLHKYIPKSMPTISELRAPATHSKIDNGPRYDSSSGVSNSNNNTTTTTEQSTSLESSLGDIHVSSVQRAAKSLLEIDYSELVKATNEFNSENQLGQGGFGQVYKGEWKELAVAIKVMNYRRPNSDKNQIELQQSYNELKYLNSIRHDNILALYGYSINGEKPCLVYQLMKGGSLEFRLRIHTAKSQQEQLQPLTWRERFNICLGTAKGIYFLHTARNTPLIHGDIKPANILLDQCGQPKIGDFGLAREGPKSINAVIQVKQVFGTRVYLPPEFLRSKQLSTGVDIFSFGIVLLEVFSGRLMTDRILQNEHLDLPKYVKQIWLQPNQNRMQIFDKHMKPPMGDSIEKCICAIDVGLKCTSLETQERPSMGEIVNLFKAFGEDM